MDALEKSDFNKTKLHHKRRLVIIVISVALIGLFVLWEALLKADFIPKRFGVVDSGQVYRSGQLSRHLIERILRKYNIKVIVCLTGDNGEPDYAAEIKIAEKLGIKRLKLPLRGNGTGDIKFYAMAIQAICKARDKGLPVLVHCNAGTQRTGGVIAMYRLFVEKKDVPFVVNEMESYDWSPKGNPDLLPYLNDNMEKLASLLYQMKVIDKIPDTLPHITVDDNR